MTILECVFTVITSHFSYVLLRSGRVSRRVSVFTFSRYLQIVFQDDCNNLPTKGWIAAQSCYKVVLLVFKVCPSGSCVLSSLCAFAFHFPEV